MQFRSANTSNQSVGGGSPRSALHNIAWYWLDEITITVHAWVSPWQRMLNAAGEKPRLVSGDKYTPFGTNTGVNMRHHTVAIRDVEKH